MFSETVLMPTLFLSHGLGHQSRCRALARSLGCRILLPHNWLFSHFDQKSPMVKLPDIETLKKYWDGLPILWSWEELQLKDWVLVDGFRTPQVLFQKLNSLKNPFVGWDEGGVYRRQFPFLVDTLPGTSFTKANVLRPELLDLPIQTPMRPFVSHQESKVLVVFGGGDPAHLTAPVLQLLLKHTSWKIDAILGPLSSIENTLPQGITLLPPQERLVDQLGNYDLVITSWGLTMMESLQKGTPVLLCNPTTYHEALSRRWGLPSLGVGSPRNSRLSASLLKLNQTCNLARQYLPHQPTNPSDFWKNGMPSGHLCPVCGKVGQVQHRMNHRTYFECKNCSMEFMHTFDLPPLSYSQEYFFESYQSQYGKTYLQDFEHIQKLGQERIDFLWKTLGKAPKPSKVLDLGCAYGPFLSAAKARGLTVFGSDISSHAVSYVQKELGIQAVEKPLESLDWNKDFGGEPPQWISLWYVIEHFTELESLRNFLLKTLPLGGLLSFSTPNARGITRIFSKDRFWESSPQDHFTLWSPRRVSKVLGSWGFETLGIRMTGEHPERFPGVEKSPKLLPWITLASRWFRWGETFEVYARRIQ